MVELAQTPPLILLGATLPVVGFVALVLWQVRAWRPLLLVTFVWGAVAAPVLSLHANHALLAHAPALTPILLAPLVEEMAKAAVLGLLFLARDGGVRTGIACGALAGLGFSLTENVGYLTLAALQDGQAGVWRAIWLRGVVGGAKHAVFTATAGAALGRARVVRANVTRVELAVAGLAGAVAQHVLWNGVASYAITDVLCNAVRPGGPCGGPDAVDLLIRVPALTVACLGPGALVLVAISRRARERTRDDA
jgi:RsiW-degrading membrane proteinase PrsW (M82 family)